MQTIGGLFPVITNNGKKLCKLMANQNRLNESKYGQMQNESFKPFHAVAVIALAGVFIKIHTNTSSFSNSTFLLLSYTVMSV